jgi:hypothetical protein
MPAPMSMTDFDLGKIVSTATATAALVIASAIFLGNESSKYAIVTGRLNELARELRDNTSGGVRRQSLRLQLDRVERRAQLIRQASAATQGAMLTFVLAILAASTSTAFPALAVAKLIGVLTLGLGLLLLIVAIVLEFRENALAKRELLAEIADLPVGGGDVARDQADADADPGRPATSRPSAAEPAINSR